MKGTPIEFYDSLTGYGAVKNFVLRKPGSYIDGIPARFEGQVQVDDGHHIIVCVALVVVQNTKQAGIICFGKKQVLLPKTCMQ